jgi:hypothetical protein
MFLAKLKVLPVLASTPTKAKAHSSGVVDPTFFGTTIKDEHANLVVKIGMEEGTSISIQPKSIVAIAPSLALAMEDSRIEETKAIVMER